MSEATDREHLQALAKWVGLPEEASSLDIACEVSSILESSVGGVLVTFRGPLDAPDRDVAMRDVPRRGERVIFYDDMPPLGNGGKHAWYVHRVTWGLNPRGGSFVLAEVGAREPDAARQENDRG